MAGLLISVLALWFVLSLLAQFASAPCITAIKVRDHFALIPSWTFFAPNPGVSDTELLYRDLLFDGQYGSWVCVESPKPPPWRALWNPGKRQRKAIIDLSTMLIRLAVEEHHQRDIILSIPYLALLSFVSRQPRSPLAEQRQFMLARTFGSADLPPEILFVSGLHRI